MGCHLHFPNPHTLPRSLPKKPTIIISSSSSSHKLNQQPPVSSTAAVDQRQPPQSAVYGVKFKTLGGCKLGISRYPDFEYDAEGGTGDGTGTQIGDDDANGEISVSFDVKTLYIPPLTSGTTRFLGLPLTPFLKIDIVPELFEGIIERESGKVDLQFKAKFWFSIGSIYRAPPLTVATILTSEESKGALRSGRGQRLNQEGNKCRLVGVATVDPIDDFLMNSFLSLPTECLAILNATISFSSST
ncbi:hypothetical protein U1Q18_026441 [Sarracenia purpurea var. burkii]